MLFSGSSHDDLAKHVARELGKNLGEVLIETFPDGEIGVQILENVRGRDIFILQSVAQRPNHFLMELLIMIDAFKRASVKSISVVLPYYGYARQDRKDKGRVPITAKLVADLLQKAGADRALMMDLHTEQIQGFFDIPVDHLYARPILVKAIKSWNLKNPVVVSPDIGSNKMARKFAEDLKIDIAIVDKRRVGADKVEANALIGDVNGKDVILVDDMCSTGETLKVAAKVCKSSGAASVRAAVTHGLLVEQALLEGNVIEKFLITDSIPNGSIIDHPKIERVSVAPLLSQAIECIVSDESISSLFKANR